MQFDQLNWCVHERRVLNKLVLLAKLSNAEIQVEWLAHTSACPNDELLADIRLDIRTTAHATKLFNLLRSHHENAYTMSDRATMCGFVSR